MDDCSKDRTAEIVTEFCDRGVVLIRHKENRNYGGALKTGFRYAKGDYLAFMDADGTYPPEYYPADVQALMEQNADLVIGSRMAGVESEMPLTRRIGNTLFAGTGQRDRPYPHYRQRQRPAHPQARSAGKTLPAAGWPEFHAGDEYPRPARRYQNDRSADQL